MIDWLRLRIVPVLFALLVLVLLGWYFRETIALALQGHRKATLSANQTKAVSDSAHDAIDATGAASARQQASDDLTRSNADAIDHAKGADAPVDPAARDAGLVGLCRRSAYRSDPKCLRFTPAR